MAYIVGISYFPLSILHVNILFPLLALSKAFTWHLLLINGQTQPEKWGQRKTGVKHTRITERFSFLSIHYSRHSCARKMLWMDSGDWFVMASSSLFPRPNSPCNIHFLLFTHALQSICQKSWWFVFSVQSSPLEQRTEQSALDQPTPF